MTRHVADVGASDRVEVGRWYGESRRRLCSLLADLPDPAARTSVDACPGWTIHCVTAHLLGVVEDAAAGRIRGIPDPSQTAEQVRRHRDDTLDDMVQAWQSMSPPFEQALTDRQIWPALFDVLSHEFDIRSALGDAHERTIGSIEWAATALADSLDAEIGVAFDSPEIVGAQVVRADAPFVLRTSAFEFFRLRLGRRSRDQVVALDWSRDPASVLDRLFVFTPRTMPLDESTTLENTTIEKTTDREQEHTWNS